MWATFDVLMCTASIWHMCTMSMDRYFTLKYPMKYGRNKTRTTVALKICFVWILSIAICSPVCVLGFMDFANVYNRSTGACVPTIRSFIIYGSLFAFCIPLCIMVVTYVMTIKILCDNQKLMKSIAKQQGDRKGRKERNGAYSMTYLTPNVYVPRFMERASIDTTLSGITINETSVPDTLSSPPREEIHNLATPLVPEPCGDWSSKQSMLTTTDSLSDQDMVGKLWEAQNGPLACQDPWTPLRVQRQAPKPPVKEHDGVLEDPKQTSVSMESIEEITVDKNVKMRRHKLVGRTNSGFSCALDPDSLGSVLIDETSVIIPTPSSSSATTITSQSIFADPLSHIPTQTDFVLSSSQPHLPSAVSPPLSSIRTRLRLTSAPGGHGANYSNKDVTTEIHGGRTGSTFQKHHSAGHLMDRNHLNRIGANSTPDECELSEASSLASMLSRANRDNNSEFETAGDLQEKLSRIEQEMDEYLQEIPPLPGVSTCANTMQCYFEPVVTQIDCPEGNDESDSDEYESNSNDSCDDPAEQSLYKSEMVGGPLAEKNDGHILVHEIPPVLVSSPPNMSSDDTQNDSDSEIITIHLKASGCYLYQIEPNHQAEASKGEDEKDPEGLEQQAGHLLSLRPSDSTECSCDELDRECDLELYCQNETEESISESGHVRMVVHRPYPPMKKKRKLSQRIRSYTNRWPSLRQMSCKKNDAPICKVNGTFPTNVISKRTASNERKASKVLGIIFGVFVFLWTPFFLMNIVSVVCELCMDSLTPSMMAAIVWLGYMSSLANPIIYTMFNTSFRRAFYGIITCQYPKHKKAQAQDTILMTNASNWGSDRRNTLTLTLNNG